MIQLKMMSGLNQLSSRGLGCSTEAGGEDFLMKPKPSTGENLAGENDYTFSLI